MGIKNNITKKPMVAYTREGAKNNDYIAPTELYVEAFNDVKTEVYDDGSVLLYKDGENGEQIGMGWTTIEMIDDVTTKPTQGQLRHQLERLERSYDGKNYDQDYYQKRTTIMKQIWENYNFKEEKTNLGYKVTYDEFGKTITREFDNLGNETQNSKIVNNSNGECPSEISTRMKLITNVAYKDNNPNNTTINSKESQTSPSPTSNTNVQETFGGYKTTTYLKNGKMVTREFDNFGRETIKSKMENL